MSSFFKQNVKTPIVKLLKSGASPSSIALAMAFGVSGGIFPIPGVTTVPVMAAIFLFRLNPVAAMLTNYLMTPLNIASIPVFIYYGNALFGGGEGDSEFAMSSFMEDMKTDTINTLLVFRFTLLHAIYLWLLTMPVLTLAVYGVLTPVLRRVMPKSKDEGKHA
ncbi:unnamed protein product [Peronospora farinosa]|uniref:DUF2062 domain-containing protein n=1 Tax=Peronospora farinosa TaxID=134698 RepID=A0AAV0SWI9_9STRA|nr:unnamed protein product [Peronospora farinosa]CAI5707130.1 unnamed protein product [Peronospora farinosa]